MVDGEKNMVDAGDDGVWRSAIVIGVEVECIRDLNLRLDWLGLGRVHRVARNRVIRRSARLGLQGQIDGKMRIFPLQGNAMRRRTGVAGPKFRN